jgi:hypothetical protein
MSDQGKGLFGPNGLQGMVPHHHNYRTRIYLNLIISLNPLLLLRQAQTMPLLSPHRRYPNL